MKHTPGQTHSVVKSSTRGMGKDYEHKTGAVKPVGNGAEEVPDCSNECCLLRRFPGLQWGGLCPSFSEDRVEPGF